MASQGDPRVLFVMNLVLSFVFSSFVVWGLAFLDMIAFDWGTVAFATAILVFITHIVIMR
jgi:hypothetical protein